MKLIKYVASNDSLGSLRIGLESNLEVQCPTRIVDDVCANKDKIVSSPYS